MNPKEEYDLVLGSGTYINSSAKLYRNINFRKGIVLFMDENTFIGDGCTILVPKLTMQKGSQICAGTVLAGKDEVILEENAVCGYGCILLTSSDNPRGEFMNDASPEDKRAIKTGYIILRKNSFVGSRSLIMPSVEVGERTVIGAFSYIDESIPSGHVTPKYFMTWRQRE